MLADTNIKLLNGRVRAGNGKAILRAIEGATGRLVLPPYEVIAFLGLSLSISLLLYPSVRGDLAVLRPRRWQPQVARSCLDLANNLCVVVALRHIPLTLFYILVFLAPMVTTLGEALFLGEQLEWRKSLAILLGFGGVMIAVNPFGTVRQGDWQGYAACLVCVACFSTNMVWSRRLTQTETPESLTFVSGVVMVVAGFGCMLWDAEPVTLAAGMVLAAMGCFCALGTVCFFVALKHTSAANVSQYHYTQLVTGALIAYLIWGEKPTAAMVVGGLLILVSGVWMAAVAAGQQGQRWGGSR